MNLQQRSDFKSLLAATLFFGAASGIITAVLANYLADVHSMDAEGRGWLELPRELPGFLIMFVVGALLLRLRETQMAALAMALTALGGLGLGYLTPGTTLLVIWVIIWSMGDHIIFAVEGPIGLKLAKRGNEGHRLGQLGGARNLGTILGVGGVFLLARQLGDRFSLFFLIAAGCAILAGVFYLRPRVGKGDPASRKLVFRREYGLFYAISALFGIRKQLFYVFGTWVLVDLQGVPLSTIALLVFLASTLGVVFRPLLGDIIDKLGERTILAADEVLLLLVCLIYAFSSAVLPAPWDLYLLSFAYVLDHILFALRVARTTYLKKIARDPADITPTISLGITIDHVVAMSLPILSGWIWVRFGHEWVFVLAGVIAMVGFFVCLRIRVPAEGRNP